MEEKNFERSKEELFIIIEKAINHAAEQVEAQFHPAAGEINKDMLKDEYAQISQAEEALRQLPPNEKNAALENTLKTMKIYLDSLLHSWPHKDTVAAVRKEADEAKALITELKS